jgi:hypothetical protein
MVTNATYVVPGVAAFEKLGGPLRVACCRWLPGKVRSQRKLVVAGAYARVEKKPTGLGSAEDSGYSEGRART